MVSGTFYIQLEDDILAKPNYVSEMKKFAIEKIARKEPWFVLDFCQLGFIGELYVLTIDGWGLVFCFCVVLNSVVCTSFGKFLFSFHKKWMIEIVKSGKVYDIVQRSNRKKSTRRWFISRKTHYLWNFSVFL